MPVRIRVPQRDGEIRLTTNGDRPAVYPVNAGICDVADADVPAFVGNVRGAEIVTTNAAAPAAGKE